ncbi:hypothetical protein CFIO01_03785 [Colletotrichum fioriniae PJ7]|uniref:Uncharacterized protein n=1 Tax=Colletotrichum fioriniae PJ7 TaxID=1445577 RepID=A0A010RMD6_9PEZI|nr:hypothetical protein CFIO01_03785 [Colletotrichum fioriniae PJ7]
MQSVNSSSQAHGVTNTLLPTEPLPDTTSVPPRAYSRSPSPGQGNYSPFEAPLEEPPKDRKTFPAYGGQGKHITRKNWLRFFTGWAVHFPALASTIAILFISQQDRYWYSEEGVSLHVGSSNITLNADTINNLLQLPAKIHELLIIASLSSIVLAMFRRSLILDGVRLGFLTGGYRVGDLTYLGTSAFWRQGLNTRKPWEFLLAGFVVFATLISTIIGPASAVLLVPTLGWYSLDQATDFQKIKPLLFYALDPESVTPSFLQEDASPLHGKATCKSFAGFYVYGCPAAGFSDIWSWAQSFRAGDLGDKPSFHYPPTELRRELVFANSSDSSSSSPAKASIILSTTPPHFLMVSLGLFSDYMASPEMVKTLGGESYRIKTSYQQEEHKIFQPFVQSKCRTFKKPKAADLGPTDLELPIKSFHCFEDENCLSFHGKSHFANKKTMTWLDDEALEGRPVSDKFRTVGENSSILLLLGQLPEDDAVLLYACGFMTSWVLSNFTFDPKDTDILKSSFSDQVSLNGTFNLTDFFKDPTQRAQPITFDRTVLDYLVPSFDMDDDEDGSNHHYSALGRITKLFTEACESPKSSGLPCVSPVDTNDELATNIFLSKVFGVYLTEVLSRTSSAYFTYLKTTIPGKNLTLRNLSKQYGRSITHTEFNFHNATHFNDTRRNKLVNPDNAYSAIQFTMDRYGYGSGHSRPTLDFALSTMYIYLGVVGIYAAIIGTRHLVSFFIVEGEKPHVRVLSIIPWSDLQDLIVLALKSSPPLVKEFKGAGTGLRNAKHWNLIVKVMADKNQNLTLAVGDSDFHKKNEMDEVDYEGRFSYS